MWPNGPVSQYADHGADPALQKPKRRKIEIACELCRLRKSRCDGGRPKCGACMKRRNVGLVCVYSEQTSENPVLLVPTYTHASPIPPASIPSPSSPDRTVIAFPATSSRIRQETATGSRNTALLKTSSGDSGMLHRIRAESNDQSPHEDPASRDPSWMLKAGLLAASSSTSFFNTVFGTSETAKAACDDQSSPATAFDDSADSEKMHHAFVRQDSMHSTEYVLPPRSVADELLGKFFKYAYIHWIDRLKFMRWYESLWIGDHKSDHPIHEQIYHAHLNIIFALAYQSDAGQITHEQNRLAQTYFLRAKRLLQFDLLELNRLDLIYALLLLTQWFQSVNDVRQCTALVRLSILVANNLGLHLPDRIKTFPSQRAREIARRAWHGCILMDRITAMVSGQPLQISQPVARDSSLFDAIDDEYLATDDGIGAQPPGIPPVSAFFRAFCELHIILGDVLENSQQNRQDGLSIIDINHIIEVDNRLEVFVQELPSQLRIEKEALDRSYQTGPMVHLHARFLHIKIMLYRPFFVYATNTPTFSRSSSSSPAFAEAITHQGLLSCVRAAQEILDLLASRMLADEQGPHLVPQRWHTVTYVYTATTVLIAAHIFPTVVKDVTASNLASSISQAFQVLDHQSNHNNDAAKRCKMALSALYEKHGNPSEQQSRSCLDHAESSIPVQHPAELGWDIPDLTGDLWSSEGMESLLYNTSLFAPESSAWF